MPYKQEICKAGKTTQYSFYYSIRCDRKEGSRRKKENKTCEAQKKVNTRQAEKKLTWILDENFCGRDLYVTWSYQKDKRPENADAMKKDTEKLLRKLRKLYKAEGKVLKYVWVAERGERGAAHVHMVLNEIEAHKLKDCWDKGFITIKPMDDDGNYRRLAAYFIKYSDKTMKTEEGLGGKRYNSSKNLKIPQPEKRTVSSRNAYSHSIVVPSGWYLDRDSIREAWHEVTGFMYFTYTLVKDGRRRNKTEREAYTLDLDTGTIEINETRKKGA